MLQRGMEGLKQEDESLSHQTQKQNWRKSRHTVPLLLRSPKDLSGLLQAGTLPYRGICKVEKSRNKEQHPERQLFERARQPLCAFTFPFTLEAPLLLGTVA